MKPDATQQNTIALVDLFNLYLLIAGNIGKNETCDGVDDEWGAFITPWCELSEEVDNNKELFNVVVTEIDLYRVGEFASNTTYLAKPITTALAFPNTQTVTKYPATTTNPPKKWLTQKEIGDKRAKGLSVEGEYSIELQKLLKEFGDVFAEPTELPPKRSCDHRIPLKDDIAAVNIRPYKYPPN
ncbi:hypothetical protein Tco_1569960 [Tanacetum coccineum]